jgi:hypothetical protein
MFMMFWALLGLFCAKFITKLCTYQKLSLSKRERQGVPQLTDDGVLSVRRICQ